MEIITSKAVAGVSEPARAKPFSYQRRLCCNAAQAVTSDVIALIVSFMIADFSRSLMLGPMAIPLWLPLVFAIWIFGGAAIQLYPGWGLSPVALLQRLTILSFGAFGATAIFLFLSQSGSVTSRLTLLIAFFLATWLVPLARIIMKAVLCARGTWGLPAVLYGSPSGVKMIAERLTEERGTGYIPQGCFTTNTKSAGSLPCWGSLTQATRSVPLAILSTGDLSHKRVEMLLHGPLAQYRRVIVVCSFSHMPSLWLSCRDLGGISGFEMSHNLLDPCRQFVKRAVDLAAAIVALPLWGPLFLLIALLTWAEDGKNPFFLQERVGLGGRRFRTWKFRTMIPDAEAVLQKKLDEDAAFRAEWEGRCKIKNDPRITRVGRILRRTSLDEIPQLINVLRGDMSLVGPRPLPPYHSQGLPHDVRDLRERVRPGMTGLWQVSGRSQSGNEGMVRWDPYYVHNWSIWLDIVVLVRTVRAVLRGGGAY